MVEGNENVTDILDASKIIEFVEEMESKGNYPSFDDKITVEKVYCQYNTPSSPAVDSGMSPALAKFTIPIVFEVFEDAK